MSIDKSFLNKFIKSTEYAAYGASAFIGKGNKILADKGAVDMMRNELNKIDMKATIVIGEGEMDEAPMLHIGEKVGTNNGPELPCVIQRLSTSSKRKCSALNLFFISRSAMIF